MQSVVNHFFSIRTTSAAVEFSIPRLDQLFFSSSASQIILDEISSNLNGSHCPPQSAMKGWKCPLTISHSDLGVKMANYLDCYENDDG